MSINNSPVPNGNIAVNPAPAQQSPVVTISPQYNGGLSINGGIITYTPGIINTGWIPITTIPIEEDKRCEPEKKKEFDCKCKKCQEFYPQSEPNQEDGTLICWACRHGY